MTASQQQLVAVFSLIALLPSTIPDKLQFVLTKRLYTHIHTYVYICFTFLLFSKIISKKTESNNCYKHRLSSAGFLILKKIVSFRCHDRAQGIHNSFNSSHMKTNPLYTVYLCRQPFVFRYYEWQNILSIYFKLEYGSIPLSIFSYLYLSDCRNIFCEMWSLLFFPRYLDTVCLL